MRGVRAVAAALLSAGMVGGCAGTLQNPLNGELQGVDPRNDTSFGFDARADIVNYAVYYQPNSLTLSLKLALPSGPATDPNWTDPSLGTEVDWYVDTTDDEYYEFIIGVFADRYGNVVVTVLDDVFQRVTCTGTASFGETIDITIDPVACFGSAGPIRLGTRIRYESPDEFSVDAAPHAPDNPVDAVYSPWMRPRS